MTQPRFMSRIRLSRACATIGIAALVSLTGCSSASDPNPAGRSAENVDFSAEPSGALTTLGFNPGDDVGEARSEYAQSQLDGVTIDMDTSDFDPQKFAAMSAAGSVPDVIQLERGAVGTYAQKGLIMPLDRCFEAKDVDPGSYWYESVINDVTYEGAVYGAPQFFQASTIIANKKAMGEAGVTVDDLDTSKPDAFIDAVTKMNKAEGSQVSTLGFDPDLPGSQASWFAVFGGAPQDDNGAPTLDTPENVKALEWEKKLMDAQGGFAPVTSFKQTWDVFGNENPYAAGQLGAGLWPQWYVNVLSENKDAVDLVAVPLKDHQGQNVAMAGGTTLAIPAGAKNPQAACSFVTEVTSEEAWMAAGKARAETRQQDGGINTGLFTGSPVADKAVRDAYVKPSGDEEFDQIIATNYEVLEDNRSFGASPVGGPLSDALGNATSQALSGEREPKQALSDAQKSVKREFDALG